MVDAIEGLSKTLLEKQDEIDRLRATLEPLTQAALSLADSLEWDITDSGHAVVRCHYDLAEQLSDAAAAYRASKGIADPHHEDQKTTRDLAALVRR